MMAVKIPACGLTPDAIANAIASGSATTPTVMPAARSRAEVLARVARLQAVEELRPEAERRGQRVEVGEGGHRSGRPPRRVDGPSAAMDNA